VFLNETFSWTCDFRAVSKAIQEAAEPRKFGFQLLPEWEEASGMYTHFAQFMAVCRSVKM
jgi:hypothetical protein